MKRRTFVKSATLAALTSGLKRSGVAGICSAPEGKRVAFGGIQIECSTYSRVRSRLEDFTVKSGQELADEPFFSLLNAYPYPFHPTLLATAVPGGPVARETYHELKAQFLRRVTALLPLDGLYLAMHGAMYVEEMQDAEGDWISATRQVVGRDCLITKAGHYHRRRRREFLDFMNEVMSDYPRQEIHVVLDNLSTHKPKRDRWRARHPNVHWHYTPTHASWLNQVEIWFSILTRQALRGASFTSPRQVREAIDRFLLAYNAQAAPFEWRKRVVHSVGLKKYYGDLRH